MKYKLYIFVIIFFHLLYIQPLVYADGGLVAFYKLGAQTGTLKEIQEKINDALVAEKFEILGSYNPAKDTNLMVITFTRHDLVDITLRYDQRGLMAGIMRVGLIKEGDSVQISLLNPEYLFYAYLRDDAKKIEIELNQISLDVKAALIDISTDFQPFVISSLSERELKEFRYLVRNPGFDDALVVMEFDSFENGLDTIRKNLQARKDGTYKVYEIVVQDKKVAIFGIGLQDPRKGEANFLKLLGVSHLAALPYELVLIDKKASILHGKYRFPLYWSDLSMTEYRKIYKTPRDIEETMKSITR
jgi:hypothetical protein